MKNKIKVVIVFLVVCFICTGCMGDVTRGIRHAGFTLSSNEFSCSLLLSNTSDVTYQKLKYVSTTQAITSDGKIYDLSLGQKFSNEQNCKGSDFPRKVTAILDDSIVKGDDDNFYYLSGENMYSQVSENDSSYGIYTVLFEDATVKRAITADGNNGVYLVLKSDGNIYKFVIVRNNTQSPYTLANSEIVYSKGRYGKIIDFNYDQNNVSTYIRTEETLYRMKKTNADECDKYADVKCNFVMEEDSALMEYDNYIYGFNGQLLITSYGKVFNVA